MEPDPPLRASRFRRRSVELGPVQRFPIDTDAAGAAPPQHPVASLPLAFHSTQDKYLQHAERVREMGREGEGRRGLVRPGSCLAWVLPPRLFLYVRCECLLCSAVTQLASLITAQKTAATCMPAHPKRSFHKKSQPPAHMSHSMRNQCVRQQANRGTERNRAS